MDMGRALKEAVLRDPQRPMNRNAVSTLLRQIATVRVDLNVIEAGMTEYFCIHMAATITPKVKFTAIRAERDMTAVTVDNGRNLSAKRAGGAFVGYDNHDMSLTQVMKRLNHRMWGYAPVLSDGICKAFTVDYRLRALPGW